MVNIDSNIKSARKVHCKCCKYERCVSSRISYGLKRVIPWIFKDHFILLYVYLIVRTIVIFTHIRSATYPLPRSVHCKFCKNKPCVILRIIYDLKLGIPWQFLSYYLIICIPYCGKYFSFHTHKKCNFSIGKKCSCNFCKYKRCFGSRSSYGLKRGLPWIFKKYHLSHHMCT